MELVTETPLETLYFSAPFKSLSLLFVCLEWLLQRGLHCTSELLEITPELLFGEIQVGLVIEFFSA